MRIDIKNGYVEMRETLTRKAYRDYQTTLMRGVKYRETGEKDEDGKPHLETEMGEVNVEAAAEALVLALIQRVVEVKPDGAEAEIALTRDWLDGIEQADFAKIEKQAMKVMRERGASVKK